MLGECQSKCEHIAKVPLRPDTAWELYQIYLVKGILASAAIEGNTLSEQEARDHLEGKLKLPLSREYLGREISNILDGCNTVLEAISIGEIPPLTVESVKEANRTILKDLDLDENVVVGEIRKHAVGVGRYRGAPPENCEYLLEKLVEWLNGDDFRPSENRGIVYAIIKAVLAHLYLAWIHPFGDGNGRTARLLEFQILLTAGVPAASSHLLSNHYNLTRTQYYRELDRSSKSGSDSLPFLSYAVGGFLDGLKQQIDTIWAQQWDITWRNYVHEHFSDKTSPSHTRRRHLVLDLSLQDEPISALKIPETSARLARAYAKRTHKTLIRDLNEMTQASLIQKTTKGYRANKEIILAFLPKSVSPV